MVTILELFGERPVLYYVIAFGALLALLLLAGRPGPRSSEKRAERLFLLVISFTLFAFRWPTFIAPFQLGPDEAAFVADALKVTRDLAPWRNFDAGTSGPLNCYVLALPALIGLPINFCSARIIGLLLLVVAMLSLYFAGKWIYGRDVARLCIVPPVLLLSLTTDFNFVQYTSEYLSICLTTVALAAGAYLAANLGSWRSRVIAVLVAGICLGAVPFAKLQASPIAAAVFIVAILALIASGRAQRDTKSLLIAYLGGLLLVPATIAVSLWVTKMWNDAWTSYIRTAFDYMGRASTAGTWVSVDLAFFFGTTDLYPTFLEGALAVILLGLLSILWTRSPGLLTRWAFAASVLVLLASLASVYQAHRYFEHYLLFSVVPITACVAGGLALLWQTTFGQKRRGILGLCYIALFTLPMTAIALSSKNEFVSTIRNHTRVLRSAGGLAIERYARPGDLVAIWGWEPRFYVETQTIMATRDAETSRQIYVNPYREYFRNRFLRDLKASRPGVFVDAVSPNAFMLVDRASQGHEAVPALAAYVQEHYELKEDVSGIRIYLAKTP
jgi:hypothetical protein